MSERRREAETSEERTMSQPNVRGRGVLARSKITPRSGVVILDRAKTHRPLKIKPFAPFVKRRVKHELLMPATSTRRVTRFCFAKSGDTASSAGARARAKLAERRNDEAER